MFPPESGGQPRTGHCWVLLSLGPQHHRLKGAGTLQSWAPLWGAVPSLWDPPTPGMCGGREAAGRRQVPGSGPGDPLVSVSSSATQSPLPSSFKYGNNNLSLVIVSKPKRSCAVAFQGSETTLCDTVMGGPVVMHVPRRLGCAAPRANPKASYRLRVK